MRYVIAVSLFLGSVSFADYTKGDPQAMEKMMKATSPGEHHAVLKDFVGNWKTSSKFWMDAKAKPEESKGKSTSKLIMGGRFLHTEYKGTAMGKPFTGTGYLGYDNIRGEYQSVWIDSMSTAVMTMTGTWDAATKTLTENGTAACAMTGEKDKPMRSVMTLNNKNQYTLAMYTKGEDGNEFKNMEIIYTKK